MHICRTNIQFSTSTGIGYSSDNDYDDKQLITIIQQSVTTIQGTTVDSQQFTLSRKTVEDYSFHRKDDDYSE